MKIQEIQNLKNQEQELFNAMKSKLISTSEYESAAGPILKKIKQLEEIRNNKVMENYHTILIEKGDVTLQYLDKDVVFVNAINKLYKEVCSRYDLVPDKRVWADIQDFFDVVTKATEENIEDFIPWLFENDTPQIINYNLN
jgi:DNA-binding cell septation regulator SpoVG